MSELHVNLFSTVRRYRRRDKHRGIAAVLLWVVCAVSCSTTKHLPEGEILYSGVKEITVTSHDTVPAEVSDAVKATLEVKPNAAFLGSAYKRSPFPFGLWMYNLLYTEKETGFRHWLWTRLKSDPILLSEVNPAIRCEAARIAMADEGYFDGSIGWDTVAVAKHPREAKVSYCVNYPRAKYITDVRWIPTGVARVDSLVAAWKEASLLRVGDRYRAVNLEEEQTRITSLMKDAGYYHYKSSYIRYLADSTLSRQGIALRVHIDNNAFASHDTSGVVVRPLQPAVIDSVNFDLDMGLGFPSTKFDTLDFITVGYRGRKARVKNRYLRSLVPFRKGDFYRPEHVSRVKSNVARLNTFRYSSVSFLPLPSSDSLNHLLMDVDLTYALPWHSSVELNGVYKDNEQLGPGIEWSVQRRNLFGGGELLKMDLTASHEWNTGRNADNEKNNLLNSYEFGIKASVVVPRLQFPHFHIDRDYPVSTTYSVSANIQRRSGYFQMMKLGGEVKYDFYTNDVSSHSFSPLKLSYVRLIETSYSFDTIVYFNRVLSQTFADQFIPKMEYTYTFDNRTTRQQAASQQWLQVTAAEAGGIIDVLMGWVGKRPQGERQLLWQPFSQFIKGTVDFRNYWKISSNLTLATRAFGGIVWAYGNSSVVPFSEQFYIGGANSLRGFSIRSVGPGGFVRDGDAYGYMDQTGDIKLEANVELRFPLLGSLNGAVFADAGNVWTFDEDDWRDNGKISSDFFSQLATDVGLGLRYDLGMLVVRLDMGIPLHDPSLGKNPYCNVGGNFFSSCGYHLAIGYPF